MNSKKNVLVKYIVKYIMWHFIWENTEVLLEN